MASVSVFETKGRAEESNKMAASWVKESLEGLLGPVEITAGEAVAHVTAGELIAHTKPNKAEGEKDPTRARWLATNLGGCMLKR